MESKNKINVVKKAFSAIVIGTTLIVGSGQVLSEELSVAEKEAKILKANTALFKKLVIKDPVAIRCYRAGMQGDPDSAMHAYILAKNEQVTRAITREAESQNFQNAVEFSQYMTNLEDHKLVKDNMEYLARYQESYLHCSLLLAEDPEEAKKIEAIVKKLEVESE